jgi:hypothetical protein
MTTSANNASRQRRQGPYLTPNTAQAIIDTFSRPMPDMDEDLPSSSSQSPDSLYSESSPRLPDTMDAFEFDHDDYEEHDVNEYEALVEDDLESEDGRASPAWGRWPQNTSLGGPGWTPLPSQGARHGSIISISPRGSVGRRGSAPISKLSGSATSSNPNLLFPEYQDRRRSSSKSVLSTRRRSSVFSTGSSVDPVEADRLRKFASMSQLARRFSELVQVISPMVGEEEGRREVDMAREMISSWSPYSTETEESEILTAPYVPTPQGPPPVPVLLSNFPLSSSVREVNLNTPDTEISPFQPATRGLAIQQPAWPATPPQPEEPRRILRARVRPNLGRTATGYEFPAQNLETIAKIGPRPSLRKAISTPQLSAVLPIPIPAPSPERTIPKSNGPTGSFPLARSQPIGLSRLRQSAGPVQPTIVPELRRPSFVAERRISIVENGGRRISGSRKLSATLSPASTPPRKLSVDSRKGSSARKLSSNLLDVQRPSMDGSRKSSNASRQSSVVSLGEYGYLAGEITNEGPGDEDVGKTPTAPVTLRERRNAPPAIILPPYQFPARTLLSPGGTTPRYNPLDSFFGRSTPALSDSSSHSVDPLSPSADILRSPYTPNGVLDRGRPVTSPELAYAFPKRQVEIRASPEMQVGKNASRSPSYKFPVLADSGLLPPAPVSRSPTQAAGPRVTFDQLPLKSILVHKMSDGLVTSTPLPPAQSPISDIHLSEDIQAHLRSKRESRIEQAGQIQGPESPKKPPMARQSSFTRLFQRAKAQASSAPHSLAK